MKSKIFSFLIFSSLIILGGCKEDAKSTVTPEGEQSSTKQVNFLLGYYNFIQQRTDVSISVESETTLASQNEDNRRFTANAGFRNPSNKVQNVSIGNIALTPDATNSFNNSVINRNSTEVKTIYGTTANFVFTDLEGITHSKSLYIPKALNINFDSANPFNPAVKVNTMVTWNADERNTKGVIFMIEYDPDTNPVTQTAFPTRINKAFATNDVGNYKLTQNDIQGLPIGASVRISVSRANYEVFKPQESGKTYSLYGHNLISTNAIVQ